MPGRTCIVDGELCAPDEVFGPKIKFAQGPAEDPSAGGRQLEGSSVIWFLKLLDSVHRLILMDVQAVSMRT